MKDTKVKLNQLMSKITHGLICSVVVLGAVNATAQQQGTNSGGGGDEYTLDFIKVATQVIYPWLLQNGSTLKPAVDPNVFLMSVEPKTILSANRVYESCDGSNKGREVEACYNAKTGKTYLSRLRYPLKEDSSVKTAIVAHEVFRKMGLEGDGYEVSQQMSITHKDIRKVQATREGQLPDGSVAFSFPSMQVGNYNYRFESNAEFIGGKGIVPQPDEMSSWLCKQLGFSQAISAQVGYSRDDESYIISITNGEINARVDHITGEMTIYSLRCK